MHIKGLFKYLFIIILFYDIGIAQVTPSDSGSYFAGFQNITLIDSSRSNRQIPSIVYYPALSEGNNAPIDNSVKHALVSFGHGFTINPNIYIHLYRHLASWGYVVIAPSTETSLLPSHQNFALDLAFVLRDMKRKSRIISDFFYNAIDTLNTGVFGHSMGGGCSFLAGFYDPSIKAVSSLAAANTNPSSITAISQIFRPVQLLSGQRDSIASYWSAQMPHYNNANPFKQIINIKGGNHSQFHLLPAADDLVDNPATISRPEQQKLTRRYVTAFFNLFLKNDTSYKSFLYGNYAVADTGIIMTYQLPVVSNRTDYQKLNKGTYEIYNYPNPFNPQTEIYYSLTEPSFVKLKIYDINGKEISMPVNSYQKNGSYKIKFDASGLPSGVYFYSISSNAFKSTGKMVYLP